LHTASSADSKGSENLSRYIHQRRTVIALTYMLSMVSKVVDSLGAAVLAHWLLMLVDATDKISMVGIGFKVPTAYSNSIQ
jgi:hypothetical protein